MKFFIFITLLSSLNLISKDCNYYKSKKRGTVLNSINSVLIRNFHHYTIVNISKFTTVPLYIYLSKCSFVSTTSFRYLLHTSVASFNVPCNTILLASI